MIDTSATAGRIQIKTKDLFAAIPPLLCPLFDGLEYPWEALPRIAGYIDELLRRGIDGYTQLSPGVWVGRDVKIAATATIEGTAVIGHGTVLRPGAYLRGGVFAGEGCVIGNSTELKNCILMDHVQVPHYNYVGDSILGCRAHMGAGAVCSNLKSDGRAVTVHCGDEQNIDTGLRKFGAVLGDGADIGCGCVLSPGAVIGRGTSVYPLTHLRGAVPAGCIVKSAESIVPREPR